MILSRILNNYLTCLFLTIIIEAIVAFVINVRTRRGQLIVLLTNIITNPIMNSILLIVSFYLTERYYYAFLIPLEIAVVIIEALIFRRNISTKINPFLFSLILNASSYFIGTFIVKFI